MEHSESRCLKDHRLPYWQLVKVSALLPHPWEINDRFHYFSVPSIFHVPSQGHDMWPHPPVSLHHAPLDFVPADIGERAWPVCLDGDSILEVEGSSHRLTGLFVRARAFQCFNTGAWGRVPQFLPVSREKPLQSRLSSCSGLPPFLIPQARFLAPATSFMHWLHFLHLETWEGLWKAWKGFHQLYCILSLSSLVIHHKNPPKGRSERAHSFRLVGPARWKAAGHIPLLPGITMEALWVTCNSTDLCLCFFRLCGLTPTPTSVANPLSWRSPRADAIALMSLFHCCLPETLCFCVSTLFRFSVASPTSFPESSFFS